VLLLLLLLLLLAEDPSPGFLILHLTLLK